MMRALARFTPAGVAALAAVLGLTAAAPTPAPRFPQAFATDLGVTHLIAETDADAVLGGVQIFVAAGLDRETPRTSGISALVAECLLRTPVKGTPLREAVAAQGGSLTYTVDGRSVHYYLEARAAVLPALVRLVGSALAAPDFSPATIAAARGSLTSRISENDANALAVGIAMFRQAYYLTGAGGPALGSAASLAQLGSVDLKAFFAKTYKRGAVFASAVGNMTSGLADAVKTLASALPDGAPDPVVEKAKTIPAEAPRIIAHRDIGAPWAVVGFAAPAPGSRDFGAMLVLEKLLSDAFERDSATTLGFVERSVGAFYLYDSSPASLVVYVNGTQADPSLALRELLVVSHSLSLKPLGAEPLRRYKSAAEGEFILDSTSLSDRSYLLGTFESQGLGTDAINAALAAVEKTTGADVQRVAKNYLQRYIVALVLPRQSGPQ
jgi:predicted Zn-dependent peptidase